MVNKINIKKNISLLLSLLLVISLSSINSKVASDGFISPVKNGIITLDYNAKSGLKCIHIRSDDVMINSIEVQASADGKITSIGKNPIGNISLLIEHEDGYSTVYGGLSELNYSLGDEIKQGDIIGITTTNSMSFVIIHNNERLENTKELIGL